MEALLQAGQATNLLCLGFRKVSTKAALSCPPGWAAMWQLLLHYQRKAGALHYLGSKQLTAVMHYPSLSLAGCHPLSDKVAARSDGQACQAISSCTPADATAWCRCICLKRDLCPHADAAQPRVLPRAWAAHCGSLLPQHNSQSPATLCLGASAGLHWGRSHAALTAARLPLPASPQRQLAAAQRGAGSSGASWRSKSVLVLFCELLCTCLCSDLLVQALCCGTAARVAPATRCCKPCTHTCMGRHLCSAGCTWQSCIFFSGMHDADTCNLNRGAQPCLVTCRWRGGSVLCSNRLGPLKTAGQAGRLHRQAQGRAACRWGLARQQAAPC